MIPAHTLHEGVQEFWGLKVDGVPMPEVARALVDACSQADVQALHALRDRVVRSSPTGVNLWMALAMCTSHEAWTVILDTRIEWEQTEGTEADELQARAGMAHAMVSFLSLHAWTGDAIAPAARRPGEGLN
jgi:hypothetical protein